MIGFVEVLSKILTGKKVNELLLLLQPLKNLSQVVCGEFFDLGEVGEWLKPTVC
jgi:hypothetical protein